MASSVYVHIPFCDSICYYCDFCRFGNSEYTRKAWLNQVLEEIQSYSLSSLDTLYFGGGTPSVLSMEEFKKLSQPFTALLEKTEWTVECNPDSLSKEKIQCFKELGVNRISLGVQTFQDEFLQTIGRKHSSRDIYQVIQNLKDVELTNISIDLMYGLPNQTIEDVKQDVYEFLKLDLPHLSIYSLQIEEGSVFGKQHLQSIDEDLEADMYECIETILTNAGYIHYETSSYCKPGFESKHNLAYWRDQDFIGIGIGASGKLHSVRYDNTRNMNTYLNNGPSPNWIETTQKEKAFEAIMMGLRTIHGFSYLEWNKKYGFDFLQKYESVLKKWDSHYLVRDHERIYPTQQGMEILNTILVDFLSID